MAQRIPDTYMHPSYGNETLTWWLGQHCDLESLVAVRMSHPNEVQHREVTPMPQQPCAG